MPKRRVHPAEDKSSLRQLSHDEVVYLAGLFDGEGHLRCELHRQRNRTTSDVLMYASFQIANTSKPLMDWLASIGGSIQTYDRSAAGHKRIYYWCVYRQADIFALITQLRPWLKVKPDIVDYTLNELAKPRVWNTSNWNPPVTRGEAHRNARLTDDQVREIRTSTESGGSMARRFGVYRSTVNRIRRGDARRILGPIHTDSK